MKVTILAGHPGSGKSTWARAQPNGTIISADDFFLVNGKFIYDVTRLGDAHCSCLRRFVAYVTHEAIADIACNRHVIVDNTNTKLVDIAPYVRLAQAYGVPVEIRYFRGEFDNVHGVPEPKVMQMLNQALLMWEEDIGVDATKLNGGTRWASRTFRCSVTVHES